MPENPSVTPTLAHHRIEDKHYKFDADKLIDAPRFVGDFVQVVFTGDFAILQVGLRRDYNLGQPDSNLVEPVAMIYLNPTLLDKMADIFSSVIASRDKGGSKNA
jgi:hypothetical protein